MNDNELRGIILQRFYDKRGDGEVFMNRELFYDIDSSTCYRICDQLYECGLINWKSVKDHSGSVKERRGFEMRKMLGVFALLGATVCVGAENVAVPAVTKENFCEKVECRIQACPFGYFEDGACSASGEKSTKGRCPNGVPFACRAKDWSVSGEELPASVLTDKSDEAAAFRVLFEAGKKGDASAQYLVAKGYRDGIGVKQDRDIAVRWFHASALGKNEKAMLEVGKMYWNSKIADPDCRHAIELFEEAAEKNNEEAWYWLSEIFSKGSPSGCGLQYGDWQKRADEFREKYCTSKNRTWGEWAHCLVMKIKS